MQGISSHLSFTGQYNAKTIAAVFLNDKKPGSGKSTGAPNGRVNALVAELNAPNASQELRNRSPGLAKVRIPKTNDGNAIKKLIADIKKVIGGNTLEISKRRKKIIVGDTLEI